VNADGRAACHTESRSVTSARLVVSPCLGVYDFLAAANFFLLSLFCAVLDYTRFVAFVNKIIRLTEY
jgi:hypothetical protein